LKSRRTIEQFIEMRAQGKSFDEIVKKTGVSKPTLISWGKIYKDEIVQTREMLTKRLVKRIAERNIELINTIAENMKRAMKMSSAPVKERRDYIDKSYRRIGDIFKVKVKEIELTINKEGDVVGVWIKCEQPGA
jgi:transposase